VSSARKYRLALGAILLLALGLRVWDLGRNGWSTEYYAASVRSMSENWHNFLFNAFDPTGFVSIDKPPIAFWIQVLSVKLFGFKVWSLLLPQVLEGVGSVLILHHLVSRRFGAAAGLLAALFLAVTPISVAVDRTNNTDSCLVLVLLLAFWAMSLAVERGSWRWLLAALALVGVGFNVKMLAACVVLPSFTALYLYAAPVGFRRRALQLAATGAVFAVIALSWCVAYDATAPSARPYVDGSSGNSMLELAIGHNGLERLLPVLAEDTGAPTDAATRADRNRAASALGSYFRLDHVPTGPLRLANPHLAGQVLWLLPLALFGAIAVLIRTGWRRPLPPPAVDVLLWLGWAATYAVVYSAADGIFFAYYLVTMAPPLAALAAIGCTTSSARDTWTSWLLPVALAATAGWQALIEAPYLSAFWDWRSWLYAVMLGGTALGVLGLAAATLRRSAGSLPLARDVGTAIALVALLVTPVAWALSTVIVPSGIMSPAASLALLAPSDELRDLRPRNIDPPRPLPPKLLDFLGTHQQDATYLLAMTNSRFAAPLIIATGRPVLSIGGFNGNDPILTPERLAGLVTGKSLRYVLLTEPDTLERFFGAPTVQRPVTDWIEGNGSLVDPALWRTAPADEDFSRRWSGPDLNRGQLWDLRPQPSE
jgi:4-amino-4-deoxy-L-arabinose transferase-like glycosyltransferase